MAVSNWKTPSSNPLRWQYKLSTTHPETLDVIVKARDTTRLEIRVGSCLRALVGGRATGPNNPDETKIKVDTGRVSLGLIFRYRESEQWAVLVAHGFDWDYKVSVKKGVRPV